MTELRTRTNWTGSLIGLAMLLAACGGNGGAPAAPSVPPSSPAAKPSASAVASEAAPPASVASAKPAASGATAASAKPAGSAAASASAAAIPPAKPGTITIAWVGASPSFAPIWVGIESGLFDKYGAPVQMINTTAPPAMAALLAGDVQIAVDGGAMIGADPNGQKLAFIAAQQNAFNQFAVYAKPEIKSLAQLKGRTVGAASPGSAATVAFETILKSSGLDPKNDVKWAFLGTPAAQWTALSNGNVDASINAFPYTVLSEQGGFTKLADAKEMKIPGASNTLGVSRQWVKDNAKLVDAFLRGLTEAAYLANTDKSKFVPAISKWTKVTDQAQLDDAWVRFSGTFPEPPYITKEAVQEAINDE
ncbi:MAG TPA: ABC transporter substrate-binding protein, partial [Chloroflexota bacterium]|nr:ABC transporter substrate-binding protein [Chloroflexota bacterium]